MQHAARWLFTLLLCWSLSMPVHANAETVPPSESHFPLLPGLEQAVEFWQRVFTEFGRSQIIYFDPDDTSRIYEIVDAGPESRPRTYIESERARVAAAHGVEIDRVRSQRGIKERTAEGLQRSGRLIGHMQQIFRERGLPVELTYLPLIESSFDFNARSRVGASGMWQFMRGTGRQFMRVERHIDERRDPLESTRAAASFLEQNYQSLGNWPLAITAYNFGPAGVRRAVSELASDDLAELIRGYQHPRWGFAAKNFYAEFLAAVEIVNNMELYFPGLELDPPVTIHEIELKRNSPIAAVAKSAGMSRAELLQWNPALSSQINVIPAGYRVKIPADRVRPPIMVAGRQQIGGQRLVVRHRVRRGETVSHIARRYGASADEIMELNGIRKAHLLRAGTTIEIPKL